MKVTLVGHASVLVELEGATCLMDPVFHDPFEEGAVVSCPSRRVDVDRLPPIDVIVLSHQHLDHFDIPTLASLPRTCDVLCPQDKALTYALDALGFEKVHPTAASTNIKFPTFELLTTLSSVTNVTEFGVIFKDRSGTFWNQVDSVLMPPTIQASLAAVGRIDLLFAMYASQNFGFFENQSTGFPSETHAMNLGNIAAIGPRLVVPGSAGFRFAGPFEWANPFLFPVARSAFLDDLKRVAPDVPAAIGNPGDVFEVSATGVEHHPAASPFVEMLEDDTHRLAYDPTAAVPELADPNPDGYASGTIAEAVAACFEGFAAFVRGSHTAIDGVTQEYRRYRASYAVGVVFPDGHEERLLARFQDGASATVAAGPAAHAPADVVHRIAASALVAWATRRKSYFYFRGFSRSASTLRVVERAGDVVSVKLVRLTDLLTHYLTRKAPGADMALKQRLDLALAPYRKKS